MMYGCVNFFRLVVLAHCHYLANLGRGVKYCDERVCLSVSVCLSVCLLPVSHIWKTACPQFSVRVICGHGSVLWRQCNLCNLLRTSGFVGVCAYRLICHPSWRQKHPFAACAVEALPIVCFHHSARGGRVHSPLRGVTGRSLLSRLS